jgi:hypothetical protein
VLRYIQIALFGAFILLFVSRVLETSLEIGTPFLFILVVASGFFFGWMMPKIAQFMKGRWKQ